MRLASSWLHGLMVMMFGLIAQCSAFADEIRPGYLQITEIGQDVYQVLWKVPARGDNQRLSLNVEFDPQIESLSSPQTGVIDSAYMERWSIHAFGGLPGKHVAIEGLSKSSVEVLMRIQYLDGSMLVHRFTATGPRYIVEARPSTFETITTYLALGIEHILIGVDHLLFVLVLLLLVENIRNLLWTITAFTAAHSITLSLAALEVIQIPVPPVEACIALSIAFVATEIIRSQKGYASYTKQRPWIVAFIFGLLHGLGFAAALGEIGLPQTDVPAALLFFNIGVEIGQLLFVAVVLLAGWLLKRFLARSNQPLPSYVHLFPVYIIGSLAMFWTIERTVGFWS